MIMEEDVAGWQRMMRADRDIPIERVLHDGEKVTLGGTTLVAHRTPGHTRDVPVGEWRSKRAEKHTTRSSSAASE